MHTRRTPRRLPDLAVVGGTCGEHFVQVPQGSRWSDAVRNIAWQEAYSRVCAFRREGAGETDILRTVEQNESQVQVRSVAGSEKQTVLSALWLRQTVYSERERSGGIEQQDRWDNEAINNVIGVSWRIIVGKWIVERPVTRTGPLPPPPVPFEGA